ncbi:MAG TPA: metal ABC transporter substrate-binding protein [Dehalococcoidia bacterium]|nr:metal ABC transporter substrate-binding protein [Dehalococcoidia bacterium]
MRPSIRALSLVALLAVLLLAGALGAACGGDDEAEDSGQVKVTATLGLFGDLVRNVGGDRVQVSTLVPTGTDVHTYEPPPSQIARLSQAKLVVMNGLDLEHDLEKIIQENVSSSAILLELAADLPTLDDNPHLWLDVQNGMTYVERIRDALASVDPAGADVYRANADRYLAELRTLDQELTAAVESVPPESRKLVTFHDAYPYLAQGYGLEIVAVVVESPGQEPSAQDVADLTQAIDDEGVPAVFTEPQFSARILELAADDAGVDVCVLYSDAFSDDVQSYVDLTRFNANELARCLGGTSG